MILNALIDYYDRLEKDPDQGVAVFGFARQSIHFCLLLNPDGTLHQIEDLRQMKAEDRSPRPTHMTVPHPGKKRTSGIRPYFLWDKCSYVLGRDAKEEAKGSPEKRRGTRQRLRKQFEAFQEKHISQRKDIPISEFAALCTFLTNWDPTSAESLPHWEEMSGSNFVFRVCGQHRYLHEIPECQRAWVALLERAEATEGVCLVTNEHGPIAKTHPPIKGVIDPGGQAEKSIVSFNQDAFKSYKKEQSHNAPVSVDAAFKYTTAANWLLADHHRRVRLADATVIFWAEHPIPFEDEFGPVLNDRAEDEATIDHIRAFMNRLKSAREDDQLEDADVPFYILGLSPNASRLSVRFWQAGTVQQLAERLGQHLTDLELDGAHPDAPPITLRRLVRETARPKKNKPDLDSIPPLLAGAVLRAVLTGGPYPQSLFNAVLTRIRADGRVNHRRAAILKAFLVRKYRIAGQHKEIPVSLNKDHPSPSYHLGRLFASLEKTQEEAYDNKLNSTIKDRYFSSASANPVAAFPRLMRLHTHHLNKIGRPGRRTNLEKLVQEVYGHLDGFPGHLPLDDQGLFFIGYYHQRQDLFTKKSDSNNDTNPSEEN